MTAQSSSARSPPKPLPKPPLPPTPKQAKPPLPKPPVPKRPAHASYASAFVNPRSLSGPTSPPPPPPAAIDDSSPHAPYRSPEKVEDDEALPQAHELITEHVEYADGFPVEKSAELWKQAVPAAYSDAMDVDEAPDKAQVGPGVLPRRLLELVHPHDLVRPTFDDWPSRESTIKPVPATHAAPAPIEAESPFPTNTGATLEQVIAAVPGGSSGEWYFCTECWAWLRVVYGQGELRAETVEGWIEAQSIGRPLEDEEQKERLRSDELERRPEISRFKDLVAQRATLLTKDHHFHAFEKLVSASDHTPDTLYYPPGDPARVDPSTPAPDGWVRVQPASQDWKSTLETAKSTLYVSCCSNAWLVVDRNMIPAQIPKALANDFTALKAEDPAVGWNRERSVFEAWSIWALLLSNAAIEGDSRWCSTSSKSFQKKAGWGLAQAYLADAVHFGFDDRDGKSRIGPISVSDSTTEHDLLRRCMLRAWIEISLFVSDFFYRNEINGVTLPVGLGAQSLAERISPVLERYPFGPNNISPARRPDLDLLGASVRDVAPTIVTAYELQLSCDSVNAPLYLGALQSMERAVLPDVDLIALKVATESSMGKFSKANLDDAYAVIGYDSAHIDAICSPPEDAPDTYLFKLYRAAGVKPDADRQKLQDALACIAKARESDYLRQIATAGSSAFLTLAEAYKALSVPPESIDEGIIMQYQEAIKEFPQRKDHCRVCLQIIAEDGGEARAGIKYYLDKGELDVVEQPVRKDLPVGLHNIGNTCYLNSILQYLYAIKPLREAVITFDKPIQVTDKPEVERSRRFVRQLRNLFLQLGKSDSAAIRPEQELAYLAITRPEDDDVNDPPAETLHPSPSSTRVNSPVPAIVVDAPTSRPEPVHRTSVLGKRASQDRDDDDEPAAKSEKMDVDTTVVESPVVEAPAPPPLPPRPKPFNPSSLKFGLQQDSAEVLINVLNQLELALDPVTIDGVQVNLVQNLFSCKFRQQMLFSDQAAQVPVESVFVPPILGVEEQGKDIYDCLGELYLQGEEIEYEGRKGVKMDLMDSLPPLLYVQLRRSQYDFATGRESKTNTHVAFGQTLVMDRFLANADPDKRQQSIDLTRKMAAKRSRLHYLTNPKPMDITSTFLHVKDSLAGLDLPELGVNNALLEALGSEAERVKAEIGEVETELRACRERLDRLWEGECSTEYELMAVFMHRGKSSGAGHYWTYQAFLPEQPDRFFKYNDAEVTEVPMSEVLQDRTGQDANPALLCYVRKGTGLIQTLCRE